MNKNPILTKHIPLDDFKKIVEALDMLSWEKNITLQKDSGLEKLTKQYSLTLAIWEREMKEVKK